MINETEILQKYAEQKVSASPANTRRNQEQAITHFNRFLKEKYQDDMDSLCDQLNDEKKKNIKIICSIIQAWINWCKLQNHSNATVRTRFFFIKDYLASHDVTITREQKKQHIKLPKKSDTEMYALKKDELRQIIDKVSSKRKSLFLTQASCGCRIGELCQIRKSDIDTTQKRWVLHIRAETTKTQKARSTFMSKEAMKYTKPILDSKNDNDLVWANNSDPINAETTEQVALRRAVDSLGLGKKYDTGIRKITSHSFRAYFATKAVRVHGENYMNKLIGHAGYLMEYDRYDDEKKLEMYLKLEPHLLVFESYEEDVVELREQNKMMQKELVKIKEALQIVDEVKITHHSDERSKKLTDILQESL